MAQPFVVVALVASRLKNCSQSGESNEAPGGTGGALC
jgi:hypothetical protein